jgi:hypothetical protein
LRGRQEFTQKKMVVRVARKKKKNQNEPGKKNSELPKTKKSNWGKEKARRKNELLTI